ncbi:hypothetical protein PsW64_04793 [Pseudovibrio sp. W64]|nr:hypothetical protein PsW64_04793 [Pseudovibrio sp. W64]
MNKEQRLDLLMRVAYDADLSMDMLEVLSRDLDAQALRIFCGNVSTLPKYKKSRDVPYRAFI